MRAKALTALTPLLLAAALAGCGSDTDKAGAGLAKALDDMGVHGATYEASSLIGGTVTLTGVKGKDGAGAPVTAAEVVSDELKVEGATWTALRIRGRDVSGGRLSASSLSYERPAGRQDGTGRTFTYSSSRTEGARGTLHGLPYEASEVVRMEDADGSTVRFTDLRALGQSWGGTVRVAQGPLPGSVRVRLDKIQSERRILDVDAVVGDLARPAAMAYGLSPDPVPAPPAATLLNLTVSGFGDAGRPATPEVPDPAGFADPAMRTLIEAFAGMARGGVVAGEVSLAPRPPVKLTEITDVSRREGAWKALGVTVRPEKFPGEVSRVLMPLVAGNPGAPQGGMPPATPR